MPRQGVDILAIRWLFGRFLFKSNLNALFKLLYQITLNKNLYSLRRFHARCVADNHFRGIIEDYFSSSTTKVV